MKRGFTIIELVVVLGIVLILIGIMLPVIGRSRESARLLALMNTVRQDGALIAMYLQDQKGIYPLVSTIPQVAAMSWHHAMVNSGYVERLRETDPTGFDIDGMSHITMSLCMVYDPQYMRKGYTRKSPDDGTTTPVYDRQVVYPSAKGLLIQLCREGQSTDQRDISCFCCAGPLVRTPVGMVDGSIVTGTREDFAPSGEITVIDGIGMPVYSTWGGYLEHDKSK